MGSQLEIFNQDGSRAVAPGREWSDEEAGAMRAYVMRWLARSDRWVRITDGDGRVRTHGMVPADQEAPPGHYEIHRLGADGAPEPEPVKVFARSASRSRADGWRQERQADDGGELAVRWVTDDRPADREAG